MLNQKAKDKLILALDVKTLAEVERFVKTLLPYVGYYKIGLELITAGLAHKAIEIIHSFGGKVFYDGKFGDIPNTVGEAAKEVSKLGVKIFNIHASATMSAMLAAVANKGGAKVYAVTVLTSIDEHESNIVFGGPSKAKVLQFARDAKLAGCDGIICSAQELEMLNGHPELLGLKKITPGIRPAFASVNDQKRVMTPVEAIRAGATHLVIGRPITKPEGMTSEEAAQKILEEISEGMKDQTKERENQIMSIFKNTNAIIKDSHLVYTSGKHGSAYVNKDAIYPYTMEISKLCMYLAEDFEDQEIDAIVGPVVGGVSLAQWTAYHLSKLQGKKILAICADKMELPSGKQLIDRLCDFMSKELVYKIIPSVELIAGETTIHTDFVIKRGQDKFVTGKQILVVEDILTTGGSVKKVVAAVRKIGGEVVGVAALCNRGGVTPEQLGDVPKLKALININLDAFEESDCPLCKGDIPINVSVGKGAEFLKEKGKPAV